MKKAFRLIVLAWFLGMALAMEAQTAPFRCEKSSTMDLYKCIMTQRQAIHRQPVGQSNVVCFAEVDCSGMARQSGNIGFRLQSVSALSALKKLSNLMKQEGKTEFEGLAMTFEFDNGETLKFTDTYINDLSTPMLNDLVVIIDLLNTTSSVKGSMQASALTHGYIVKTFSHANIAKLTIAGIEIPFTEWQSASTIRDMFKTIFEKTESNIYNPDLLVGR